MIHSSPPNEVPFVHGGQVSGAGAEVVRALFLRRVGGGRNQIRAGHYSDIVAKGFERLQCLGEFKIGALCEICGCLAHEARRRESIAASGGPGRTARQEQLLHRQRPNKMAHQRPHLRQSPL